MYDLMSEVGEYNYNELIKLALEKIKTELVEAKELCESRNKQFDSHNYIDVRISLLEKSADELYKQCLSTQSHLEATKLYQQQMSKRVK